MRAREGFSMIEVLVAIVLLGVVLTGMQATSSHFLRVVQASDRMANATQIAEDRIEEVRGDPTYALLETRYAEPKTALPDGSGFTRETRVQFLSDSTAAGVVRFARVTVTVDGPGLTRPVTRSISVTRQ